MLDYKGIFNQFRNNITGLAKTTFKIRRDETGGSTNASDVTTSSGATSSTERSRNSVRNFFSRATIMSSPDEERETAVIASEAREDGIYTGGKAVPYTATTPVRKAPSAEKRVEKRVDKDAAAPRKTKVVRKKKTRQLNIPQRDLFAKDFVLAPDEDLPGFTPIDSEYESEEELTDAADLARRMRNRLRRHPHLAGLDSSIPNEYDAVIGIVSFHGVPIPRSKPIDIVPNVEPSPPFFDVTTDIQVMLIAERMYDVFKENVRTKGKVTLLDAMENLASGMSVGKMCRRLVPIELMDGALYFYDYDTVTFMSRAELVTVLCFCESHDDMLAHSVASSFYQESVDEKLERNFFFQQLMDHKKIFCRRTDYVGTSVDDMDFEFPFVDTMDNEHNQRMIIERQLENENTDHEEVGRLIRSLSQDLEEIEREQGIDFIHKSTLSLFDARVLLPIHH